MGKQSSKEEDRYCRSRSVMLSSPHVDSCLKTSRGREAVQESAVKPPVAADNKRAVTKTATNILCFMLSFQKY